MRKTQTVSVLNDVHERDHHRPRHLGEGITPTLWTDDEKVGLNLISVHDRDHGWMNQIMQFCDSVVQMVSSIVF